MTVYSPFLQTLHDETDPVGRLGRGTHYSIFEFPSWHNAFMKPNASAEKHRLAIIWDEDHDERVIPVVEELFFHGLLSPIMFIGERKGALFVVICPCYGQSMSTEDIHLFRSQIESVSESSQNDPWPVNEIGIYGKDYVSMANDDRQKVQTYLDNIHMLWSLGMPHPNSK